MTDLMLFPYCWSREGKHGTGTPDLQTCGIGMLSMEGDHSHKSCWRKAACNPSHRFHPMGGNTPQDQELKQRIPVEAIQWEQGGIGFGRLLKLKKGAAKTNLSLNSGA
jgi:hypothetical protein